MGNFSYLCSGCEEPINVGWNGPKHSEHVMLFLMVDGEVTEWMVGNYDGYGRVRKPAEEFDSQKWETRPQGRLDTDHPLHGKETCILDLDEYGSNGDSGICAYHSGCYTQGQPEVSDSDPEQGFGDVTQPTNGGPTKSIFLHEAARRTKPVWKPAQ